MKTLLKNATLIDCVQPRPRPDTAVLVEDGRIREIFDPGSAPAVGDAEVLDLRGAYLMPGLWDVHIHPDYLSLNEVPLPDQVTLFGHRLQSALLDSGIVGFRCAGAHHFMDVAWKRAFESGQHLGPRLFAAGHFLTTTGGHFLTSGHALEVDGPYGFVHAIREQIKNGVDHIKLNLSGGIMGPAWDLHRHSFLLEEELKAAFEICKLREFKVMAHATNPAAVKAAIRLGAHSIEHGYILDDECIELFLQHGTWYVPTLSISHLTPGQATNDWESRWVKNRNLTQSLCCRADAASDEHRTGFKKALQAGVKMALGSDIRPLKDAALLELGLWVRDGATPWQALVAATRNGAAICGVGDELGTIEPGKIADLIVVGANPLEDINNVRRLQLVMKDGRIVSDKREKKHA
ncbi:amidohydrolase family protein [Ramlibacter ginsenosidimutans]|uniref:Amidohydrolase family protein n=2 Tax=Ramlibacter ginsenosidimutans TaxID=502333 RepID=A0A934TSQ0_9BURK|nr:amidohydrolase family protein [Ramlibacter ginsenosidimutans]MBK6006600.1 amidohydrolase family protein [Ramlibacter ginsenosidimutans]